MTLEEFLKEFRARVDKFEEAVKDGDFDDLTESTDLPEEEWVEQLDIFVEQEMEEEREHPEDSDIPSSGTIEAAEEDDDSDD